MPPRSRVRLAIIRLVVLSLLVTLTGRLGYMQLVDAESYRAAAVDTRLRTLLTPAVRGTVLDADGEPLAANRSSLVIAVDPLALADQADGGAAVVARLADVLGTTPSDVQARITSCGAPRAAAPPVCYAGSPAQPAPVAEDVATDVTLQIVERPEAFPGVTAGGHAVRTYPRPQDADAAHLLGYLSPVTQDELVSEDAAAATGEVQIAGTDLVGRTGLDEVYDTDLRGRPGERTVSVDSRGTVLGVVSETEPAAGHHVVTSIDAGLQAATEQALQDAITSARSQTDPDGRPYVADAGAALVMDVTDGRVLAMSSYPSYDPSVWVGGISATDYAGLTDEAAGVPLLSRVTQGSFAPASTFKVVSAAAALEAGYGAGPYDCSSDLAIGDRTFRNYESRGYGPISLARALEVSCDTVFYRIAYDLWRADGGNDAAPDAPDAISTMAHAWGFGRETGIDLPAEHGGRVADRSWRQSYWEQTREATCARAESGYPEIATTDPARAAYLGALATESCADGWRLRAGDAVNAAIGQGDMLVTPLQVAVAYAAIANGGTRWRPRVAKAVLGPDGGVVREIPPEPAGVLPVAASTLDYVRGALYDVARTGTGAAAFAGFPLDRVPIGAKTGSGEVFGAQATSWFAAFSDRYVAVMMVEQGGTGGATSGPAVRSIFDALYGVAGGAVVSANSVFPAGAPPTELPELPNLASHGAPAGGAG